MLNSRIYHIIINPASRSGKGYRIWAEQIEPLLKKKEILYQPYFSSCAGDVARIVGVICEAARAEINAAAAADTTGVDCAGETSSLRLIILGGDGTMNEVLQSFDPSVPAILGYIPTGSSNDLARDLRIPKDPAAALEVILAEKKVLAMDTGNMIYADGSLRRFAVSCGIGYDAAVCEETFRSKIKVLFNKLGLGKLTYLGIAVKQLFVTKACPCTLTLDDQEPIHIKKILFVACMNHRYEGGGFMFAPDSDPCDGILDLCVVGDLPRLLIFFALPTAFWGKHYIFPGINAYQASRIKIETSAPLWTHTDGEIGRKTSSIAVTCHRGALRMIVA